MRALTRKLQRDVWRLRGQILAIGMVIASGIAVLVMSVGALEALRETADAYYERADFAEVFATLERAPSRLESRIAAIPGVQTVETRIVKGALLDVAGFEEPVMGRLVSIPERHEPKLNRPTIQSGRSVGPGSRSEVLLSEAFAEAHGLAPGDHLHAIVNGKRRRLEVVGTALSPEFVYAIGPGALMPDDERFGILWMSREDLAAAYDFEGAFNDVSLTLQRGVTSQSVIESLDRLLAPYGGTGAIDRSDQLSNFFLVNEIDQLANLAGILPVLFLGVAAFLTHVVLTRMIDVERPEIGLLKAFGYSNAGIAAHYLGLVVVIALVGVSLGSVLGAYFGRTVTGIYAELLFHFPFFLFRPSPGVFGLAAVVSLAAAFFGGLQGIRRATRLPPAEAMRAPVPLRYRHLGLIDRAEEPFDQPTRMIFRQLTRHPGRSAVTSLGIATAVALLVTSLQWGDAIEHLMRVYFEEAQHQDATLALVEAQGPEVIHELARLPAVLSAEPLRFVRARLRSGRRTKLQTVVGISDDARLSPIHDAGGRVLPTPLGGVSIGTKLAEILDVRPGDWLTVEVLEGRRAVARVRVESVFETYIGTPAIMNIHALNRLIRESGRVSGAHVLIDSTERAGFFARLKQTPEISAAIFRNATIEKFHETMGDTMLLYVGFFVAFSCMLAFGVTYNATRLALSERARELATLRVLGLGRAEVAYILLGEIAFLTLLGLPIGCLLGVGLSTLIAERFETDLYRVPTVVEPSTFGTAMLIILAAAIVSAAIVGRRLERLDLVAVLKTRE